jgi:glycosyltransferase involved in cell wall biosynthesis
VSATNHAGRSWQLVIDAQGVQGPFNERGIARTITAVSEALVHAGLPVTAVLLNPHHALPPSWHATLRQLPLRWSTADATRDLLDGLPIVWLMLSPMEGSVPDEAIVPTIALSGRTAIVPLVHDAIPFDDELRYQRRHADARMHQYRLPFLRQAAHTLAVSRHSAAEWNLLVTPLASVSVVGSAPTPAATAPLGSAAATEASRRVVAGLNREFAIYVGGGDARKNVEGAIYAWMKLGDNVHRRFQFVVVGSATVAVAQRWRERVKEAGLTGDDVLFTGMVADADLDALHQAARVAFFPSLSEGFGMPVVEALAWGTPVVSSNTSSLPEIIGWGPGMFDPSDPDEIAAVLRSALVDDEFREQLRGVGESARLRHTWPAVAARISEALEAHVVPNLPTASAPSRKPSIAVVTSDASADGWAALITTQLAKSADVDEFSAKGDGAFPLEAFGRTSDPGRYDLRVFVLGDHADGAVAYSLARRYPGVLVLTDDRLTAIGLEAVGSAITWLLLDAYDTRLPAVLASDREPSLATLLRHDIRLLEPVVRPAHRVLAASSLIADAAKLDIGPWHRPVPTEVVSSPAHATAALLRLLGVGITV